MAKPLVIVESPAKARTIAGFLGSDYVVESSIGHIRDLPRSAAEVPAELKGEPWARLGIDVDNDFRPLYVVPREKKEQVAKLRRLLKGASEVYLATDEDREGEAIAWHLREVLNPKVPVRRMVFHEITRPAIERAIAEPRELDLRRIDAQETRRILDRLYGYEVSPVLWKKVMTGLSAGRVQSVATRMVVERERARMRFRSASWWGIDGTFAAGAAAANGIAPAGAQFDASLVSLDGTRLATGRDFSEAGEAGPDVVVLDEAAARQLATELDAAAFAVRSVERKPYRRRPAPPFMTSTLQQEAGRKLRMSSAQAMRSAQRLYEGGYITYMRTDSTTLSDSALSAARAQIVERYGPDYVPDSPRRYVTASKSAQEAHEAIRPAGDRFRAPEQVAGELSGAEARLYELIWQRTVASQMPDALGETVTVRLAATSASGREAEFAVSGTVITFPGFQRVYVESHDGDADDTAEQRLPALSEGDPATVVELRPAGHQTSPPARYTEASLVKRLEELGVGRPSTYASIIATIQDRGYVWKKGTALVPSFTAFAVVTLLERHFSDLVDYAFTARMEDCLDEIAAGNENSLPWLSRFYFGPDDVAAAVGDGGRSVPEGLRRMVSEHLGEIDAREVNSIPLGVDAEGREVVGRVGRYGPYVQRGEDTAGIPDDLAPDELTLDKALELLAAPSGDRLLGTDPGSGLPVLARAGRYGPYVQLGDVVEGTKEKPRTASLFTSMSLDTIGLDDALRLLTLPRLIGVDPADGQEVTAQNGRYGPYVKKGTDSRSLESEEQLFTVTLDDALKLFAEPKRRRGQGQAAPPLRELGDDPVSGRPMVLKEGRFGPYVTDGETNASLRKGDSIEGITAERAAELLADRRARGPAPKRAAKKKGATANAGGGKAPASTAPPAKKKKAAATKKEKKKAATTARATAKTTKRTAAAPS
ncbi:MAG TPA: type I DNA topoisomerase [Acidimicrobiales bacterium]|nr:type I DNA topoisomerase [Acidimicrobiales bacterium]